MKSALRLTVLLIPMVAILSQCTKESVPSRVEGRQALLTLPNSRELYLEIADTPMKQIQGLMGREVLDANSGMLFLFEDDGFHSIWMKNMVIPIDILWLDESFKLVHIEESVQPCYNDADCESYQSMRLARYVVELSSGSVHEHDLAVGDRLEIRELEKDHTSTRR